MPLRNSFERVTRLVLSSPAKGICESRLQQQIEELDLLDHVRLCGFLPDPRELYRAIDLFVLSSLREGLPNVVLEAMASQASCCRNKLQWYPESRAA